MATSRTERRVSVKGRHSDSSQSLLMLHTPFDKRHSEAPSVDMKGWLSSPLASPEEGGGDLAEKLLRQPSDELPPKRSVTPPEVPSAKAFAVYELGGTEEQRLANRSAGSSGGFHDVLVGSLYGLVNWIVCIPALISYAHIVYNEGEFSSVMPLVVKLYFLSSALIQLVFVCRSTLDFAVGQVQDVGLIFLAGMVRSIVERGRLEGITKEEMTATCCWCCSLATLLTGVLVVLVGKLNLGEYVQMIPLPVVGGYLGYIGWFCFVAGLQIVSDLELATPDELLGLFELQLVNKLGLLVFFTAILLFVHFKMHHFLFMPTVMLILPIGFWIFVWASNYSVESLQVDGWLPQPSEMVSGFGVFEIFDPSLVHWMYLPPQIPTAVGLVLMVAFGSGLDIAAVQEARPDEQLDYNSELVTVGLSNLVSGAFGGSTGSYIFSQTVFSAKRGVKSRANGFIVFLGELVLFLAPVDLLRCIPNAYIGAIMCLFGVDIMADWLFFSRSLMAPIEYLVMWFSFGCIMWFTALQSFGVIEGMAISTIVASFVFAVRYASDDRHWVPIRNQSSIVRPWRERLALTKATGSIFALGIQGHAFFFNSLRMSQEITTEVERHHPKFVVLDFARLRGLDSTAAGQLKFLTRNLARQQLQVILSSLRTPHIRQLLEIHEVCAPRSSATTEHDIVGPDGGRLQDDDDGPLEFETLDKALQYCEQQLLSELCVRPQSAIIGEQPLEKILLEYVDGFDSTSAAPPGKHSRAGVADHDVKSASSLAQHFTRLELAKGEALFEHQEPADSIFVVAAGSIVLSAHELQAKPGVATVSRFALNTSSLNSASSTSGNSASSPPTMDTPAAARSLWQSHAVSSGMLTVTASGGSEEVGVGSILGDSSYYVRGRFGCNAAAASRGCVAHRIDRRTIERLEATEPQLISFLQKVFLRDLTQYQVQFLEPTMVQHGFM